MRTACRLTLLLTFYFVFFALNTTQTLADTLTEDTIKNFTYPGYGGPIAMKSGSYTPQQSLDLEYANAVICNIYISKEINTGTQYASVIIQQQLKGTGAPVYLYILKLTKNVISVDSVYALGDRVQATTESIINSKVTLSMVTHGPGDGLCCPTKKTQRTFISGKDSIKIKGNELIFRSKQNIPKIKSKN